MKIPKYFISCDWGTTNFRLKVVESPSLKVIAEHSTDRGIKPLYQLYLDGKRKGQTQFFMDYLIQEVRKFKTQYQELLIVATGMASSNMGLKELEYAPFPFSASGEDLLWKGISSRNELDVLLVSGVKGESGMMRGEEVQAIGLAEFLPPHGNGTLLLPGTHSKHLVYEFGKFVSLKNFMTGELFEVLLKNSILANSVVAGPLLKSGRKAFLDGLGKGALGGLGANLLSVRANHLLNGCSKSDNYYFLSGLLIGEEVGYLKDESGKVFLAAPQAVLELYKLALENILAEDRLVCFDGQALEKAVLIGHRKILSNYLNAK
ncbi:2-dehydro-3-deoxygalactonokinase [Flavobacteriaceae bacterium F89]|uniref:2-dehydro-3-deoxygalactonokinase n=1 Tax=Cerina litoralis TaxID=2874477 RepID=A0AAE3JN80_9FLAO|nr:2-dehydro-3-deoxygalactonokinase [Cerina litoralis]MCG2459601.1 2-dehydro-3-deoxygalactonokinase [Cerina litoralis]